MGDSIVFYYNDQNFILFETKTGHFRDLGSWLTSDIHSYAPDCLELLSAVEDVRTGRSIKQTWDGNSYFAVLEERGIYTENVYLNHRRSTYSLDEAHAVIVQYWHFLTPDPNRRSRHIQTWEHENHRSHPCRGHL